MVAGDWQRVVKLMVVVIDRAVACAWYKVARLRVRLMVVVATLLPA